MAGPGKFGLDQYGLDPYGGSWPDFGVAGAVALNNTTVRVTFTDLIDFTYGPMLTPGNYAITPALVVHAVQAESAHSVLLTTDPMSPVIYTVTVGTARSYHNTNLDQLLNSASLAGFGVLATFFAVATSAVRVRAVFEAVMQNDSNLSNPANYVVLDADLDPLWVVLSATPEQATNPTSVVLVLATPLEQGKPFVLTIASAVKTQGGASIVPNTSVFTWNGNSGTVSIPISSFSGEVQNGLYGLHNGLVFFSPSLLTAAPNSIIQVDEVDVCTKAYDEYHLPQPIDPPTLFTFGGGIVPTPSPDPYLLNQCVLWAPFPRNFEARFELGFSPTLTTDAVPPPLDGPCSVTLQQPFDITRIALLNDPAWYLFNNTGLTVPPTFITAANLTPIPPGGTQILVLNAPMRGDSDLDGSILRTVGVSADAVADSSASGTPL